MDRKMLCVLALAAAALIADPASAARACRGDACRDVTPVFTQGCWSYRNPTDKPVRGVVSAGEPIPFEIPPRGSAAPRGKSGLCLRDEFPYEVKFTVKFVGEQRPRRGGQ
jgi:hypothetical protein